MNINEYLRIVKLQHEDTTLCEYINGAVFFKDVVHKRMDTLIYNPKILIMAGGAEYMSNDTKFISMDRLIS